MKMMMIICFIGATFFNVQSGNIEMKGKLAGSGPMKNPSQSQVEVYQSATDVRITFLVDLGSLNIAVVDESGVPVHQTKVNAVAGSTLTIDIDGWNPGVYTLFITDGNGGCLEGVFEIL